MLFYDYNFIQLNYGIMELILFISSISSMNVSTQPHMFVYEGTSLSLCRKGILFINSIKGDIQSLFPSQVL